MMTMGLNSFFPSQATPPSKLGVLEPVGVEALELTPSANGKVQDFESLLIEQPLADAGGLNKATSSSKKTDQVAQTPFDLGLENPLLTALSASQGAQLNPVVKGPIREAIQAESPLKLHGVIPAASFEPQKGMNVESLVADKVAAPSVDSELGLQLLPRKGTGITNGLEPQMKALHFWDGNLGSGQEPQLQLERTQDLFIQKGRPVGTGSLSLAEKNSAQFAPQSQAQTEEAVRSVEMSGLRVLGASKVVAEPSTQAFLQMQGLTWDEPKRLELAREDLPSPIDSGDGEAAAAAAVALAQTESAEAKSVADSPLPKITLDQVGRIQETVEKLTESGGGRVTFQIEPEGLGKMTIDVRQIGQDVKVRVIVDEAQTRDLIESKIGDMVQNLSLKVGGLSEVRVENMNMSSQLSDFLSQQNSSQSSQQEMAMARDFLESFRNSNQQFKEGGGYFGMAGAAQQLSARRDQGDSVQPLEPRARFMGYGSKGQTLDRVA